MGPLCNEATLARVVEHVEDARSKGAEIVQFGPEEELYYPATILTNVSQEMQIMQEETFGPVAPIAKVSSAQEAVEIANRSRARPDRLALDEGPRDRLAGGRGAAARLGQHQRDKQLLGPAGALRRSRKERSRP